MTHELTKNQKNHHFEASSPIQPPPTISRLDCDVQEKVDFIQLATVVEPKSSKASPKAKLGGLLPV